MEGCHYRLRPVNNEDAAFIVYVRKHHGDNFLHEGAQNEEEQRAWLRAHYQRDNDFYFIVEDKSGKKIGTISIYDIDTTANDAIFGRWVVMNSPLAAVESVFLICLFAFETLGLTKIWAKVVTENKKVISFHNSFGMSRGKILPKHYTLRGKCVDVQEMFMDATVWEKRKKYIEKLIRRQSVSK